MTGKFVNNIESWQIPRHWESLCKEGREERKKERDVLFLFFFFSFGLFPLS